MLKRIFPIGLIFMLPLLVNSQPIIKGPGCVVPGLTYQYIVSIPDTSATGISICIAGGSFINNGNLCIHDSLISALLIIWNSGIQKAQISVSAPSGNIIDTVYLTSDLQPGSIDAGSIQQTIGDSSSPVQINCSAATGGSCSPSYNYQWQQSPDNVSWSDISGATNPQMDAQLILTNTKYFRRKVTETQSGLIDFSNTATVIVTVPASGSGNINIQP